ncbi:hypothetical protein [Azospirillum sp.]|uniref:hypothetical protein n=1 Tax=Azospirillum sp. TaxID=34012 RepID=UPI003D7097F9
MIPKQKAESAVSAMFGLSRSEQIRVVEDAIRATRREALEEAARLAERSQCEHEQEGNRWYNEACQDIAATLRGQAGA